MTSKKREHAVFPDAIVWSICSQRLCIPNTHTNARGHLRLSSNSNQLKACSAILSPGRSKTLILEKTGQASAAICLSVNIINTKFILVLVLPVSIGFQFEAHWVLHSRLNIIWINEKHRVQASWYKSYMIVKGRKMKMQRKTEKRNPFLSSFVFYLSYASLRVTIALII